jgi:hypothetical protein
MNIFNDNLFSRDYHYNLLEGSFFQDAIQHVHQMHQLMNDIFQLEHKDESNTMNKSHAKAESTEKNRMKVGLITIPLKQHLILMGID